MNDIEKAEDDQKGEENKVGKEEKEDITIRVFKRQCALEFSILTTWECCI